MINPVGVLIYLAALLLGIVAAVLIVRDYSLKQGRFADVVAGLFITVMVFGMVVQVVNYAALIHHIASN